MAGDAGGPTPPPARSPFRPARWQVPAGDNPTNYTPNHEPYDLVPLGSLSLSGKLPSVWDPSPMNIENYRAVTVALSGRLPFAFGLLVGDGEWAMGLARNAHGHEWGKLFVRNGDLRPDTIDRVMAAWLTWRQIPVREWLRPVVEHAHQSPVTPPQPGTYGNAAVARAAQSVEIPAHYWSSSCTPSRPGESNPRALPWQDQPSRYPSSSIRTQPRPRSTAGATGALEPSRVDPPSPRQEGAAM